MMRDIQALKEQQFDVVIVGAGIFGACAAWDAALRGLSVALIEKDDFCSGASANSFKMVHGGIRYMQHLDAVRVRGSCKERSAMLRIAPHLVTPLPIAIPTYGWGTSGKPFLGAGMYLYDLITMDRNRGIRDPARQISWTRMISAKETKALFPGVPERKLTGAAIFDDAQMYNPTRLVLAFVQSAVSRGALVANQVQAEDFILDGDTATGVRAIDQVSGERIDIKAKVVLGAAGPWTESLLGGNKRLALSQPSTYSRDACFVVPRRFDHPLALAVLGSTKDPDAKFSRPARHLFVVPWRDHSLIGVWHKVVAPDPEGIGLGNDELESFIAEINESYPALDLSLDEITRCNFGLVPFGENESGTTDLRYGKRSRLIDHANTHGIENLVTLTGIRYTMGRGDAALAMQLVARKLDADPTSPDTENLPISGGDFDNFEALIKTLKTAAQNDLDPATLRALAHNHGTSALSLLKDSDAALQATLPGSHVLRAEVVNAVRNEMALTLADVVFRRTDLGTGGNPGRAALAECAALAAGELDWSPAETERQIAAVEAQFPALNSALNSAMVDSNSSAYRAAQVSIK